MAFYCLVYFVFRGQNGCELDVVLEHHLVVSSVRFFVSFDLLVVCEGLFQEEHTFGLVIVSSHLPVLPCEAQAKLAVVMVVENLIY